MLREASSMEALPLEQLEAEITELAGHLAAGECRWLELVAEYDRRAGHETWGCRTIAHWLSWHCGLDMRSAREKVRVAHALGELPLVREEFATGRLSYSKVRAITRVATAATEEQLVMLAEHATAAQVERIVRTYRGMRSRGNETEVANQRCTDQYLQVDFDLDGTCIVSGRMPPEIGAAVLKALDVVRAHMPADQRGESGSAEPPRPKRALNVDALAMMAETVMATERCARDGGDRYLVGVSIDADVLLHDDPDAVSELDDGVALAPETVRRLSCDASLMAVIRGDDGEPLTTGRRTRTIPRSVRRAVRARDKGCRFPSCGERVFIDADHIRHWSKKGPSTVSNVVELCWFHHRLVHEGGWTVRFLEGGEVIAVNPAGNVISSLVEPCAPVRATVEHCNNAEGLAIDSKTITPNWWNDPLHLGDIVGGLEWLDERGDAAPGEGIAV